MKTKSVKLGVLYFLLSAITVFSVYASLRPSISLAQEVQQPAKVEPLITEMETGNITVDFKDAEIHDVLKIISYKSGVNIVAGKDVEGTVTVRLVDVAWERALEVILKNSGFVYERDEDVIRVTTVENLGKEELSTQLFILNYADASGVCDAIKTILSDRGGVKVDTRTNQLVVTDVPTNLYKISKVIEKLDTKIMQVMIEARVIETTLDEDERLGVDWTMYASASGSARPIVGPFAFGKSYGKTGLEYFPRVDTTNADFTSSEDNGFPFAAADDFSFGTLSFTQLQGILENLKSRSDTKTLSNPKIVTLNNKEAIIHVGRDYNIPLYERNTSTGQMEITDYKTEKVGVKLTVTPHINAQREIIVDMHPEVSSFLQFDNYGNVQAPVFSIREATTQVMVKDGDTIVIGGLIKEEIVDSVSKVPILGDIPLLKYIFSKTNQTKDTTDLIIFVTVKLLDMEPEDSEQQAKLTEE